MHRFSNIQRGARWTIHLALPAAVLVVATNRAAFEVRPLPGTIRYCDLAGTLTVRTHYYGLSLTLETRTITLAPAPDTSFPLAKDELMFVISTARGTG